MCLIPLTISSLQTKYKALSLDLFFFKALKVILLCLCSALSLTSLDLILLTDVSPRLGEQELLFAFFTGKRLALKGGALAFQRQVPARPLTVTRTAFQGGFLVHLVLLVRCDSYCFHWPPALTLTRN